MQSTYLQVKEKALPIIKHYHDDLLKHDRASITKNGKQDTPSPFLHFTGDTGTALIFLIPAGEYPGPGQYVPYLFATAERHHILNDTIDTVQCMKSANRRDLVLYFDGMHPVKTITQTQAEDLASAYRRKILKTWRDKK